MRSWICVEKRRISRPKKQSQYRDDGQKRQQQERQLGIGGGDQGYAADESDQLAKGVTGRVLPIDWITDASDAIRDVSSPTRRRSKKSRESETSC